MPQVKMPDGQLVDLPEDPTSEQLGKLKMLMQGGPTVPAGVPTAAAEAAPWYKGALDTAKTIGTGLFKGVNDTVNSLASSSNSGTIKLLQEEMANTKDPERRARLAAKIQSRQETLDKHNVEEQQLQRALPQPQTPKQRYLQAAAQGVGGSALFPAGGPANVILSGVGSGLGSEGAAQAFGDTPVSRIAGGVVGGLAGGGLSALGTNKAAMAREAMEGVRPEDLAAAKANMVAAQASGIPINLAQAMERPSNVDKVVEALAGNRYGQQVQDQLRKQPLQARMELEGKLASLPGEVRTPQVAANNVQDAATAAIEKVRQARTAAWESTFKQGVQEQNAAANAARTEAQGLEAAAAARFRATPEGSPLRPASQELQAARENLKATRAGVDKAGVTQAEVGIVPQDAVAAAQRKLLQLSAERPNTEAGRLLSQLAGNMQRADGTFIRDGNQLNNVLKEATAKLKSPNLATQGIDVGTSKFLQKVVGETRDNLGEVFEPLKKANVTYKQITEEVVDPLKKSVVGRLAGRRGEVPDAEAVRGKITSLFDQGTVPGSKTSDILRLEKELRGIKSGEAGAAVEGPAAFQDAAKTWVAQKISDAVRPVGGRLNPDLPERLTEAFAGNETRSQGFRDTLVGLARSQGMPDNALYPGMEKFLKVVGQAARRPGGAAGASPKELDQIAGASKFSGIGRFSAVTPVRQPILKWMDWLKADAYKAMDSLLTSPEGVDMLQKLAKQPALSPAAQTAVNTFLATQANVETEQPEGK